MRGLYSTVVFGLLLGVFVGCASVESTSVYYLPYSEETFPPKPKDAEIPILGKAPTRPHTTIGRLSFQARQPFSFMLESIRYNARQNGADAAILRKSGQRVDTVMVEVPPSMEWMAVPNYYQYRDKKGRVQSGYSTSFVPIFQPGYVYPSRQLWTGIDAEMIRFKK